MVYKRQTKHEFNKKKHNLKSVDAHKILFNPMWDPKPNCKRNVCNKP